MDKIAILVLCSIVFLLGFIVLGIVAIRTAQKVDGDEESIED